MLKPKCFTYLPYVHGLPPHIPIICKGKRVYKMPFKNIWKNSFCIISYETCYLWYLQERTVCFPGYCCFVARAYQAKCYPDLLPEGLKRDGSIHWAVRDRGTVCYSHSNTLPDLRSQVLEKAPGETCSHKPRIQYMRSKGQLRTLHVFCCFFPVRQNKPFARQYESLHPALLLKRCDELSILYLQEKLISPGSINWAKGTKRCICKGKV